MDKTSDLFRENLKNLRSERNLTQQSLSERLDRKSNVVETYEGGRRWPDPEDIDLLAKELGVSPARLFLRPGEIPQPTPKEALEVLAKFVENPLFSGFPVDEFSTLNEKERSAAINFIRDLHKNHVVSTVKSKIGSS